MTVDDWTDYKENPLAAATGCLIGLWFGSLLWIVGLGLIGLMFGWW